MSCTEYVGSSRGFFCSNYISDTKLVFLDAQYADIGIYESNLFIETVGNFLGFLSNECKIATGQLLCGISFPDCEESADGKITFPKPVCRISCQNTVAACMEDLSKPGGEADTIKALGFTFPECDADTHNPSWDLLTLYSGPSVSGSEAVREMFAGTKPFPEFSVLVSAHGVAHEVQCFNPGGPVAVNYCDTDLQCGSYMQVCNKGNAECVFPCPSSAFTTEQYNQQFVAYTVPGIVSLVLNATMLVGLVAMGKTPRKNTPLLLRWSFLLGLLYGLVNTVPVAVLKHDLSCNCSVSGTSELDGTELCQGHNPLCTLSSLGVFLPIGILYLVAGLNIKLYLIMASSRKVTNVSNGMMFIAIGVPLLGFVMTFVLDFDPADRPDRALASFVQVRDSFSCSPRFPSLWSEFAFKQMHYLIGTVMTAAATIMSVKLLLKATAKVAGKENGTTNSRMMEFLRPLRKAKGERLVVLGLLCIVLALGTLVVSIETVSLMKQFREEAKEMQDCLIYFMLICRTSNFCESEVGFRCSSHDDCIDKAEYCSNESRCKPCYLCALDNDGVGNVCPTSSCRTTSRMNPRIFCAFSHCAPIISKLASNPFAIATVPTILSGEGCINGTCSDLAADLTSCVSEKRNHAPPFSKAQLTSCSELLETCEDPFLQFEGCECSTTEFGGYTTGGCVSIPDLFCYPVNPKKCMAAVETWNSKYEEKAGQLDVLEVADLRFAGIDSETIYQRSGCCYETSPFYTLSDACPPPKEIPNGEMIVGFFFLNCVGLVCPLIFMTNDSFNKAWSAIINVFTINIGTTSKVGASNVKVSAGSGSYVDQSSVS
jgi:hypothetical protein